MGRALRLLVIAEGVETEAQRDFLARAGCHEYQGFLFAPALETRAFEDKVWQPQLPPPRPAVPPVRLVRGKAA